MEYHCLYALDWCTFDGRYKECCSSACLCASKTGTCSQRYLRKAKLGQGVDDVMDLLVVAAETKNHTELEYRKLTTILNRVSS